MADLSKLSTADLEAIASNKLGSVSDSGLAMLHDSAAAPDDSQAQSSPGVFAGTIKSTIDSLPMLGGVAGGILGTPADALTGPAGTLGGAAIGGYLGTAAKNLINKYYDPESAPKTMADVIAQPVEGGIEQAGMQAGGELAGPVLSKAADLGKWAGTKMISNLGGVSPDVIKEYSQFSDRINSAPSVEALKDVSDNFVGKLADDVEAKRITAQQAKDAYSGLQSDLKDAYKTKGYDARDAVTSAQQTLKDAHNARLQQLSGDVYDTVNKLKSDVQSGSGQALKTLDKSGASVDLSPVYSALDSNIDKLNQAGTDESLAAAERLKSYKTRLLNNNWANVPAPEAKKLIQGLDQTTTYSPMAGSFDNVKNAAFKNVRSALDQSLKSQVPEYAAAMQPVAADTDLLNRVSDFGDKQQAVNALKNINAPNQLERRAALQQLGNKYGTDFIAGAQPENLPEHQLLQNTQAKLDALRPDRVSENIEQSVASSRQKSALDQANADYQAAQDKLAPFKPLAPNGPGQTQAQQKLLQLGKGKNIELTDMFQKLGSLTNTDFVQAMKDNNVKETFQKAATNGSRNTLMGAIVGWLFGGLGGAAIGAEGGRIVDQWGPAITKKALDGAISISKRPSVAAIRSLDLPEPIKRNMVVGLENYMKNGGQVAEQAVPMVASNSVQANRSPARGEDLWAQQGLSKLGIQDQDHAQQLLSNPRAKQLLIQASDLPPGSKALQRINDQIQKGYGKNK